MTNAVRHGRAASLPVVVMTTATLARLVITDDGAGFDVAQAGGGHVGLASMRERVEALGGELTLVSGAGKGTRIEAAVPLASHSV